MSKLKGSRKKASNKRKAPKAPLSTARVAKKQKHLTVAAVMTKFPRSQLRAICSALKLSTKGRTAQQLVNTIEQHPKTLRLKSMKVRELKDICRSLEVPIGKQVKAQLAVSLLTKYKLPKPAIRPRATKKPAPTAQPLAGKVKKRSCRTIKIRRKRLTMAAVMNKFPRSKLSAICSALKLGTKGRTTQQLVSTIEAHPKTLQLNRLRAAELKDLCRSLEVPIGKKVKAQLAVCLLTKYKLPKPAIQPSPTKKPLAGGVKKRRTKRSRSPSSSDSISDDEAYSPGTRKSRRLQRSIVTNEGYEQERSFSGTLKLQVQEILAQNAARDAKDAERDAKDAERDAENKATKALATAAEALAKANASEIALIRLRKAHLHSLSIMKYSELYSKFDKLGDILFKVDSWFKGLPLKYFRGLPKNMFTKMPKKPRVTKTKGKKASTTAKKTWEQKEDYLTEQTVKLLNKDNESDYMMAFDAKNNHTFPRTSVHGFAKPDILLAPKNLGIILPTSYQIIVPWEVKLVVGKSKTFEPTKLGQIMMYCIRVLSAQPTRTSVTAVISNEKYVQFLRMEWDGKTASGDKFFFTKVYDFVGKNSEGAKMINHLMACSPEDLGWSVPQFKIGKTYYAATNILGKGASSSVYQIRADGKTYAVKHLLPQYLSEAKHEVDILNMLKDNENAHVPTVVHTSWKPRRQNPDKVFFASEPIGQILSADEFSITGLVCSFSSLVKTLRVAHEEGFVHRDISVTNVISFKDELYIIDWACAAETGVEVMFEGNILFAPAKICFDYTCNALITPQPWHDLVSLVKVYAYLTLPRHTRIGCFIEHFEKIDWATNPEHSSTAQKVISMNWDKVLVRFKLPMEYARKLDYNNLEKWFDGMFKCTNFKSATIDEVDNVTYDEEKPFGQRFF